MERLRAVAAHYLQTHNNLPSLWRIDVAAVEIDQKGKPLRIEIIEKLLN
jgi:Holliday junction resolvase-like predicted endonuclease